MILPPPKASPPPQRSGTPWLPCLSLQNCHRLRWYQCHCCREWWQEGRLTDFQCWWRWRCWWRWGRDSFLSRLMSWSCAQPRCTHYQVQSVAGARWSGCGLSGCCCSSRSGCWWWRWGWIWCLLLMERQSELLEKSSFHLSTTPVSQCNGYWILSFIISTIVQIIITVLFTVEQGNRGQTRRPATVATVKVSHHTFTALHTAPPDSKVYFSALRNMPFN